jgi:RNA methyltransferase, TrmH family
MEPSLSGDVNMTAEKIKELAARAGRRAVEAGPHHEAFVKALSVSKGGEPGLMLAEGLWLNRQAMQYGATMQALYICPELVYTQEWEQAASEFIACCRDVFIISEKVYNRLGDEKADRGILSVVRLPQWTLEGIPYGDLSTILVLDGLENPGNVGTLIRTADGAGADAVLLCNRRTGLSNRLVVRSSLCTLLTLPVLEVGEEEAAAFLAERGYTLYLGKAESSERYCDVCYAALSAIVVGHEKYGVSARWFERAHVAVSIPMLGHVDSLNVAVAGGILLYEAGKYHNFKKSLQET